VCVCDGGRHRAVRTMMRSKAAGGAADTDTGAACEPDEPVRTSDKSMTHELDCMTGGAGSDEFSLTASPGSPLDSDEALDDLPAELVCESAVEVDKSCTSALHDKDELSTVVDQSHAKDLVKVGRLMA